MISKELLSEILGIEVTTVRDDIKSTPDRLYYETSDADTHRAFSPSIPFISVYDLAYRCREWAMTEGYQVSACRPIVQDDTGVQVINYWYKSYIFKFEIGSYGPPEQILNFDVNVRSEPEAVFKACEWILNDIRI